MSRTRWRRRRRKSPNSSAPPESIASAGGERGRIYVNEEPCWARGEEPLPEPAATVGREREEPWRVRREMSAASGE
jgi:hypothetical protein